MANEHKKIQGIQGRNVISDKLRQKPYVPLIKLQGFNPSPVAGKIPFFADSRINPNAEGSSIYNEFWLQQLDRCINGHQTGGTFIPGRYYYYLNFVPLSGLMGTQYPFFVDFDLELFNTIEQIKKYRKKGLVLLKARRKGLSEKMQGGVLSYGMRFIDNYRAAITAGRERYVLGLRKKLEFSEAGLIDEMKLHLLKNNIKSYDAGFELKSDKGHYETGGFMAQLFWETMYDNPNKLEGEFFHDVICEEAGEYESLSDVVSSIEPALEFGAERLGTFYIYGTAGNILTSSRAFKEFYDNAETLGYVKMWVPGTRLYFPFFGNEHQDKYIDEETGEKFDPIPNFRTLTKLQRNGCEDIKAAESEILRKRKVYKLLNRRKKLKENMQNYPLTEEEAFSTSGSNNFNAELIVHQLMEIEGDHNLIRPYILDFVKVKEKENYAIKVPLEVTARPAKDSDPDYLKVWIYQHPMPDVFDLDVGGFDSYNQDLTETSQSLGAVIVQRRGNLMATQKENIHNGRYPVCMYYDRPPRKEICYEIALKIAVYYNTLRNMMINAEQDFAIDYFIKNNGTKYLAPRPKSFDSPKSQQIHKYGAKMTGSSKPVVLGLLQSEVDDNCQYYFFPLLLRDLMAYDEINVGEGDWDSADALALATMRIYDMKSRPRANIDVTPDNDEAEWSYDEKGNPVLKRNYETEAEEYDQGKNDISKQELYGRWKEM